MARVCGAEGLNARLSGDVAAGVIETVHLRDLGVIIDAGIDLGPGLTVITGETGAGKTMLLTGLGLLWGERAEPSRVRQGCDRAVVDGVVRITDPALRERLHAIVDEAGGQWDDDAIVVSRSVHAEGRSRAHLGGRVVPAGILADVAAHVVAVHGQDDQMRLRSSRHQREALDAFAGTELAAALAAYQVIYDRLKADVQRRASMTEDAAARRREAEDLREALRIFDDVVPVAGESIALREEAQRLAHVDHIADALDSALAQMRDRGARVDGPDIEGVAESLARARAILASVAEHDAEVAAVIERLDELGALVGDVVVDLARLAASTEADPGRLEFIEARRARLGGLRRRVGAVAGLDDPDEEAVLTWAEGARARLAELDDDPAQVLELDRRIERLRDEAGAAAQRVCEVREEAAGRLASLVTEELAQLAMPRARLVVQVSRRAPGEGLALPVGDAMASADRSGVDEVVFGLAGPDEADPRPLARGASGGERSRIMLALEVVLAQADPVPTLVFDEVDAGVGGRAAVEVGRRLARLARHAQVLVVTHLPQVAAFADAHLVVRAGVDGQVTQASVEAVDGAARHRELARMLAGMEDSATAMAHAEELLALAASEGGAGDTPGKASRRARAR